MRIQQARAPDLFPGRQILARKRLEERRAQGQNAFQRARLTLSFYCAKRDESCYRLRPTRDYHLFASRHLAYQPRKVGLGFVDRYLFVGQDDPRI